MPPSALARKRSAAAASRLAKRRKSIVAPVESTARYQPTASRMTSGSNCRHLNRPETEDARSIGEAYQLQPPYLKHFRRMFYKWRSVMIW